MKEFLNPLYHEQQVTLNAVTNGARYENFCIKFTFAASEEYKFSAAFGLSYKVHYDTLNHTQAKASCQAEGGSLLKIDTPDKQQYVEDTMDLQYYRAGHNVFYVDGEQLSVGGHGTGWWVFSDGSPVPTLYWAPGQPNLSDPKVIRVNLHKHRKWDDGSGTNKRAYICQKP